MPFGLILTTLWGGDVDLRAAGSGNIGATNVARLYGWRLAAPALALDLLKGLLPSLLAMALWPDRGLWWPAMVGMTAFVGHCYPVFLEFRGGKGVATGAGVMLALAPMPTGLAVIAWLVLLAFTGRSSVAALGATATVVMVSAWLQPSVLVVAILLALAIALRHVSNIRRLVSGTEAEVIQPVRLGRKKDAHMSAEEALVQGPGGTDASVPLWREKEIDPLATDPGVD